MTSKTAPHAGHESAVRPWLGITDLAGVRGFIFLIIEDVNCCSSKFNKIYPTLKSKILSKCIAIFIREVYFLLYWTINVRLRAWIVFVDYSRRVICNSKWMSCIWTLGWPCGSSVATKCDICPLLILDVVDCISSFLLGSALGFGEPDESFFMPPVEYAIWENGFGHQLNVTHMDFETNRIVPPQKDIANRCASQDPAIEQSQWWDDLPRELCDEQS